MLILDTHVLVWLDEGSKRLGKKALIEIDDALQLGNLFVSTISFWEVAMLVREKRLDMSLEVKYWRKSLLDSGLQEIALNGEQAILSADLRGFHGDPADRMITATSIYHSATLCTADRKILDWENNLTRMNASQ